MIYQYHYFENYELRDYVAQLLARVEPFWPHWVQQVLVYSQDTAEHDAVCTIRVDAEYRKAHLTFCPGFWDSKPEQHLEYLLHEVSHAITGEMTEWVQSVVIDFLKERHADAHAILNKEFLRRNESITESLCGILLRVLDKDASAREPAPLLGVVK